MSVQSIYLHRDDVETILKFMNAFDGHHTVEVTSDNSSGIGSIIKATLHAVNINGMKVSVTKDIVDETNW
jgi:Holliday junction resolvase